MKGQRKEPVTWTATMGVDLLGVKAQMMLRIGLCQCCGEGQAMTLSSSSAVALTQ